MRCGRHESHAFQGISSAVSLAFSSALAVATCSGATAAATEGLSTLRSGPRGRAAIRPPSTRSANAGRRAATPAACERPATRGGPAQGQRRSGDRAGQGRGGVAHRRCHRGTPNHGDTLRHAPRDHHRLIETPPPTPGGWKNARTEQYPPVIATPDPSPAPERGGAPFLARRPYPWQKKVWWAATSAAHADVNVSGTSPTAPGIRPAPAHVHPL